MRFVLPGPKVGRVDPGTLKVDPVLTPASDEQWMQKAEACINGSQPLHYAEIPLGALIPFDIDYRPDLDERGLALIDATMKEASEGRIQRPIVYQRGFWFVVSDDYLALFAAVLGQPDYCPCFVMGQVNHLGVRNTQLVAKEDVRKVFGG